MTNSEGCRKTLEAVEDDLNQVVEDFRDGNAASGNARVNRMLDRIQAALSTPPHPCEGCARKDKGVKDLEAQIAVQSSNGNWNYSYYMLGLANGLILAHHTVTGKKGTPPFHETPARWLKDNSSSSPAPAKPLPPGFFDGAPDLPDPDEPPAPPATSAERRWEVWRHNKTSGKGSHHMIASGLAEYVATTITRDANAGSKQWKYEVRDAALAAKEKP